MTSSCALELMTVRTMHEASKAGQWKGVIEFTLDLPLIPRPLKRFYLAAVEKDHKKA